MADTLPKLASADFATIIGRATLPPPALAALGNRATIAEALDSLESAGFAVEAVRVLAHALPKRESVWWACMCAQHTAPPDLPEPDRLAREASELWVRQQSDEHRRTAMAQAEVAGFQTAETWCAAAAFWSGDSMSPLGQPVVPPPPDSPGMAVAGSVVLAATRDDVSRMPARLKRFLESGRNIAAGGPGRLPREDP